MIDFAVFILTHGRPNKVKTLSALKNHGYTGPIFFIIDSEDSKKEEYLTKFENVIVFDKAEIAKTFDEGDNFGDRRAIIYARNASFKIAKELGVEHFIQLDDDYTTFQYRYNSKMDYEYKAIRSLDKVFGHMVDFFKKAPAISSLAMAQGGDFIGGSESTMAQGITLKRKCMNSFICSPNRPFQFIGRINEDVNTYTHQASKGLLFLTTNQVCLTQMQTQSNSGGMTELYLDSGTYVKSFYSVIYQPSSVKVKLMNAKNSRLHHSVSWKNTVPMILREELKKT